MIFKAKCRLSGGNSVSNCSAEASLRLTRLWGDEGGCDREMRGLIRKFTRFGNMKEEKHNKILPVSAIMVLFLTCSRDIWTGLRHTHPVCCQGRVWLAEWWCVDVRSPLHGCVQVCTKVVRWWASGY